MTQESMTPDKLSYHKEYGADQKPGGRVRVTVNKKPDGSIEFFFAHRQGVVGSPLSGEGITCRVTVSPDDVVLGEIMQDSRPALRPSGLLEIDRTQKDEQGRKTDTTLAAELRSACDAMLQKGSLDDSSAEAVHGLIIKTLADLPMEQLSRGASLG